MKVVHQVNAQKRTTFFNQSVSCQSARGISVPDGRLSDLAGLFPRDDLDGEFDPGSGRTLAA
ncbi:MAG TPA: hypothetical protein VNF50_14500, partial [Acidimicrobiales bacterium]|nr:hypothetical protein [Acidimicrobiales bacterium]